MGGYYLMGYINLIFNNKIIQSQPIDFPPPRWAKASVLIGEKTLSNKNGAWNRNTNPMWVGGISLDIDAMAKKGIIEHD
ncbi:jg11019 [Pararge aegeria aegeria]|uniref:Jg11019 protein n=1 Tax=Pararge aegeria aegeria TaxID=348720 RepID=A0A8S4S7F7_9NEOP|nr:jg11019 [Pararge aegeria aegeria]